MQVIKNPKGRPKLRQEEISKRKEAGRVLIDQFSAQIREKNSLLSLKMKDIAEVMVKNGLPEYQAQYQNVRNVFCVSPRLTGFF